MICSKSNSQWVEVWVSIQLQVQPSKPLIWSGSLAHEDICHVLGRMQQRKAQQFALGLRCHLPWILPHVSQGSNCFPQPVLRGAASLSLRCAPSISWSLCGILRDCVHCWRQPSVTKCWHICSDSSTERKSNRAAVGWWAQKAADGPESQKGRMDVSVGTEKDQKTLMPAIQLWHLRYQPKHKV